MGNYKDNNKKKIKRNKGKKFVYRNPSELSTKVEKSNPFEELSKKKFMKQGKQYEGVKEEYQNRFVSNSFIDRRIGEGSKGLSYEDKMKMRFKAQQMINLKSRKSKYSLLNEDQEEDNLLTHRGRVIDGNNSDVEKEDDDDIYDKMDNYMEEMDQNKGKLSRKEIIQNIISRSKALKEEKQRIKQENRDKIELLDENFAELSTLLQKRGRTFTKFNDDYDRFASSFVHAERTHPTDRLKSELEIAMEKEMESDKLNKKRMREEIMKDSDEEKEGEQIVENKKTLTKKERIEKLIADRLNKAVKINKEDIISKRTNEEGDDEEDNVSDLDEFDQREDGEDYEDEDGEDFDDNDDEGDDGENQFDFLNDLEGMEFEEGEDDEEEPEEEIKPKSKGNKKSAKSNKRRK
jgi:nucleolar protein 14